jgi:uncharacterized membrane protein
MSNTAGSPARHDSVVRHTWNETKSALKTTEFYVWLVVSIAILIAAAVTDDGDDGQRFGADHAWLYVAIVTGAYIVSRGIAKAGVRKPEHDEDHRDVNGRSV